MGWIMQCITGVVAVDSVLCSSGPCLLEMMQHACRGLVNRSQPRAQQLRLLKSVMDTVLALLDL